MPTHPEPRSSRLLVTCEHGGNRIPAHWRHLFRGFEALLQTHRGYDPGALAVARALARALSAPLLASTTSRLLVDLNRSTGHPRLLSEATRRAPAAVRREIVEDYYRPYRQRAEASVAAMIAGGHRIAHVSSRSFTPELDGVVRNADIGLLYDPGRRLEALLCERWRAALARRAPDLRVRRNCPYAGTADGLTAHLRRRFPARVYLGIELEINQRHAADRGGRRPVLQRAVVAALRDALAPARRPERRRVRRGRAAR